MFGSIKKFFSSEIIVNKNFEKSQDVITLLSGLPNYSIADPNLLGVRHIINELYWQDYEYVNFFTFTLRSSTFYFVDSELKRTVSKMEGTTNWRVNSIFLSKPTNLGEIEITDQSHNLYTKNVKKFDDLGSTKIYIKDKSTFESNKEMFISVADYIETHKLIYPQYFVVLPEFPVSIYYTQYNQYALGPDMLPKLVKKIIPIQEIKKVISSEEIGSVTNLLLALSK